MSRLPQLSTPSRMATPPLAGTGIPTPSGSRRPRSSLGPGSAPFPAHDDAMDAALQEALRNRPPSSIKGKISGQDDPDTPTQSNGFLHPSNAHLQPRTPGAGVRAKTPSALGIGHAPQTPSASRSVSRPTLSGRPSLAASTPSTNYVTPRRTSMASSIASTTPHARRSESRASVTQESKFAPQTGDRVRVSGMGFEGTLRFLGPLDFKEGVWAGVELEGGFAGKGKNDGSVNGVEYFHCPPNCGLFVLASRLQAPSITVSRPASVASSHHSISSQAFSASGRQTPSGRYSALGSRPTAITPSRPTRTVSRAGMSRPIDAADDMPQRTLLGNSTSSNALLNGKITAGSRASKYVGMTAKQLDGARAGSLNASVKGLASSTTTTPKASRVSMGVTPARIGRPSFGGANMVTPKAKVPRPSVVAEMMPPPPSPSNISRVVQAQQARLEEEIKDLRRKNAELEDELRSYDEAKAGPVDENILNDLREQNETAREEAASLREQLEASNANATDATRLAEELQAAQQTMQDNLTAKEQEVRELLKEIKLVEERSAAELEAGMEAKRTEAAQMQERAEAAEREGDSMRVLIEELTTAGQAAISLYEQKVSDAEERYFELESQIRVLEDRLAKAREERDAAMKPPSPGKAAREAATAAEIDNETLNAQVKHLQNRLHNLEGELEDARVQAESEAEAWRAKVTKAKESEKAVFDQLQARNSEITKLSSQANIAKSRIAELEVALKENQVALEAVRAEVEALRAEASEVSSMRQALKAAEAKDEALRQKESEVVDLRSQVSRLQVDKEEAEALSPKIATLEEEITTLKSELIAAKQAAAGLLENGLPDPAASRRGRHSSATSEEEHKKMVGFQHIIHDLSMENTELKERCESLAEEIGLLKEASSSLLPWLVLIHEELKLLEETSGPDGTGMASTGTAKELADARAALQAQNNTVKELHREVSELEHLIESKIYHEDELEKRIQDLEKEIDHWRKRSHDAMPASHSATSQLSHQSFLTHRSSESNEIGEQGDQQSIGLRDVEERCELCEGPHELDACPVFAGNLDAAKGSPLGQRKTGKFCADCESTEHDTIDCPLAEDVF